jgi:hypothetical protein
MANMQVALVEKLPEKTISHFYRKQTLPTMDVELCLNTVRIQLLSIKISYE